jgi:hypothetical protein
MAGRRDSSSVTTCSNEVSTILAIDLSSCSQLKCGGNPARTGPCPIRTQTPVLSDICAGQGVLGKVCKVVHRSWQLGRDGSVQQGVQQPDRQSSSWRVALRLPTSGNDHNRPSRLEFASRRFAGRLKGQLGMDRGWEPRAWGRVRRRGRPDGSNGGDGPDPGRGVPPAVQGSLTFAGTIEGPARVRLASAPCVTWCRPG